MTFVLDELYTLFPSSTRDVLFTPLLEILRLRISPYGHVGERQSSQPQKLVTLLLGVLITNAIVGLAPN